ncbi:MAG: tol-pal system YbgF family protein [bacterium]
MKNKFVTTAVFVFILLLSLKPALADSDDHYSEYISTLEKLSGKKFTPIIIQELEEYRRLFPDASNVDQMLFRLASIYSERNDKVLSFYTHLKLLYLYPHSEHVTKSKDRLRSLLIEDKKFKPLKDQVETIVNPGVPDSTKAGALYAFLKDVYGFDFQPVKKLLIDSAAHFIKDFPNSVYRDEVTFWHAELLTQDKQYELALAEYMKLTFLFSKSLYVSASKLRMADIFSNKLKMHQNAIITLEEFLLEYPDDPQAALAQLNMAHIIEKKKKKPLEAIEAYTTVAKKYPQSVEAVPALFEAARIYEKKFKEYEQAIRIYNEVVRDFSKDLKAPYALAEAARVYEKHLKDSHNAANVYFKVYGLYPTSTIAAESLFAAAEISEKKLEDPERALRYYRFVVEQYPESKMAAKASKRIEKLTSN